MRLVIEIKNGCVQGVVADESCELLIIDRDEFGDDFLPESNRGVSVWEVPGDPAVVDEGFESAGFIPLNPT